MVARGVRLVLERMGQLVGQASLRRRSNGEARNPDGRGGLQETCQEQSLGMSHNNRVNATVLVGFERGSMWREQLWETDLSIEECLSRMTSSTERDTMFHRLGFHPKGTVFSSIEGNTFRLFAKGVPFVRNSSQPYFYGSVAKSGKRTLIRGRFRMHRNVETFLGVWFASVIVIGGIITVFALTQIITGRRIFEGNLDIRAAVLIPPGML